MKKKSRLAVLARKYAIDADKWDRYARYFQVINRLVSLSKRPVIGPMIKRMLLFDTTQKHLTQGLVININQKLDFTPIHNTLPIDILKQTIRQSSYRALMHKCLCRTGNQCQHYPIDLGCIFIGQGSRIVEKNGIARSITIQEALDHIDKASALGLIGQCLWIEAEKMFWGISPEEIRQFMEVCFCCPCCCVALKNYKNVDPDIQQRFKSIGWKASLNKACRMCGLCEIKCPKQAISLTGPNITVSDKCLGCGLCASICPDKVISMVQVSSGRSNLQGYFHGFTPKI